jgi:two-component system response regulator MtrA
MMMSSIDDEAKQLILIVEDDEETAESVAFLLEDAGYDVIIADHGRAALDKIEALDLDLVLLDMSLPDMNGMDILKTVRLSSFLPVIILSGHSRVNDRVGALEAGADDYVVKPFIPEELIARVRVLLRRVDWAPSAVLKVRQLDLDVANHRVLLNDKELHLTPIEYGILVTLMRNAGEIVKLDDLLSIVWGDEYKGDYAVLRVNISRLRSKVEEDQRHPQYIVTVPGQGYWIPLS